MTETLEETYAAYDIWLDRQPLTAKTRVAYRFQVRKSGVCLAQCPPTNDDPLRTPFVYNYAVRDCKPSLKTEGQGNDLVLGTSIAGHKRLETTRRSRFPSLEDRRI